jgi:hypothetical protein
MTLSFASLVTWLAGANVPSLVFGMDGAEPPPADGAVEDCDRVAALIRGRHALTSPLEVPGLCLVHLLQRGPSSLGKYTPGRCRRGPRTRTLFSSSSPHSIGPLRPITR